MDIYIYRYIVAVGAAPTPSCFTTEESAATTDE